MELGLVARVKILFPYLIHTCLCTHYLLSPKTWGNMNWNKSISFEMLGFKTRCIVRL